MDQSPPWAFSEAVGVATDDTFFFHSNSVLARERLDKVDHEFASQGMPKHPEKDVTLQSSMVASGWEPRPTQSI